MGGPPAEPGLQPTPRPLDWCPAGAMAAGSISSTGGSVPARPEGGGSDTAPAEDFVEKAKGPSLRPPVPPSRGTGGASCPAAEAQSPHRSGGPRCAFFSAEPPFATARWFRAPAPRPGPAAAPRSGRRKARPATVASSLPAARRGRPPAGPPPPPPFPSQDGGGRLRAGAGLPPGDRQVRPGDQGGRAGTAAGPLCQGCGAAAAFAAGSPGRVGPGQAMAAAGRADRAVVFQDIRDCPGPLSALTELNAAVKEKFHHLRGRIQVRLPAGGRPGDRPALGPLA